MAKKSMKDIITKMKNLDICMMTTKNGRGALTSRPMSNNGDVEYDGNSYFFTWDSGHIAKDIARNPQVNLGFNGAKRLYISVLGKAKLVRSKAKMEDHWIPQLKTWFKDGLDTPGIVMVHVKAQTVKFWQDEEQGEVKL